jgi:hypothetical protein
LHSKKIKSLEQAKHNHLSFNLIEKLQESQEASTSSYDVLVAVVQPLEFT